MVVVASSGSAAPAVRRFGKPRALDRRIELRPASSAIRASVRAATRSGPSDSAFAGSGCVSMNTPATPAATAARASTGTNSRCPPEVAPCPPGKLHRMRRIEHDRAAGRAHDRQRAHVRDQVVITEATRRARKRGCCPRPLASRALSTTLLHVLGGEELALLDVDRLARCAPPRG